MQRDYSWHSAHHLADLESVADIGTRAGTRAVARLNPGKAPGGKLQVIHDPSISSSLIRHLLGALRGPAHGRGASILEIGRRQERVTLGPDRELSRGRVHITKTREKHDNMS